MRRLLIMGLALVLVLGLTVTASAQTSVLVDENKLSFDVPPQIIEGRTLVPLRAIFEALGANVEWDGATQTVTASKGATVVTLTIGKTSAQINGTPVTLDVPGRIMEGRTLVPLRFVSEALGANVAWNASSQTVTITSSGVAPAKSVTPTPPGKVNINTAGSEELTKIIHINSIRAEQIIELRKQRPFASVDELTRVPGIGAKRIQDIKNQGIAYVP